VNQSPHSSTPIAVSTANAAAGAGWFRRLIDAFATPAAGTLFCLGFGCGLPFFLVGQTLATWLRDEDFALGLIGLISYANFFYVLKFFWAPILDRRRAPFTSRLGRRRGWLVLAQALLIVALAAIAVLGTAAPLPVFVGLVALIAFAGATQDAVVDAYRIEIAPAQAQGALVATYSAGYRLGLIAGGAGALYLADFRSWSVAYLGMAALMALPIAAALLAREPDRPPTAQNAATLSAMFVEPFVEFFRRNGAVVAAVILAFVGLYKLPDQVLGVIPGPFYLDSGFSKSDIATVSKLYGVWVGLTGTFAAGALLVLVPLRWLLLIGALAIALSNLLYVLMAHHPGQYWLFVLTISGDNFALGFAATGLVAWLSRITSVGYTATQFALLSSLANLPGKLVGGVSGFMVEAWGYAAFFTLSAVSLLPTLLLLAWLWRKVDSMEPAKGP
jgi:PAT family beta-lactamase induction signal transducer AmpG